MSKTVESNFSRLMRIHAGLVYLKLQKMMQDCGEELSPLASEKSSKSMSIIIQMSRSLSMVILHPCKVNKHFGNLIICNRENVDILLTCDLINHYRTGR